MLRFLRSLSLALAGTALVAPAAANAAPATASAAAKKSTAVYPTVSSISPRKIKVGQKLTIKGSHFRAKKSSVAFYKPGKAPVFVKADSSTSSKLVVTIPAPVLNLLIQKDDKGALPTLIRIRVIGAKMGKTWTKNSRSPIISAGKVAGATTIPLPPGANPNSVAQQVVSPYVTCQIQAAAAPSVDGDGDGLANGVEIHYGVDPCVADTDGDGINDGYEYYSAIDLNGSALPYPGKRPWPNPLDPTDADYDFDGDWLFQWQEYKLWRASGSGFPLTQYSDGTQNSGGTVPVLTTAQSYLDRDGDGNLTDDERDFDGDGLSNVTEFNFRGTQDWWRKIDWHFKPHGSGTSYIEPWYSIRSFSDLDPVDSDSDGDGVLDGADDQDADGWSNFVEMQLDRLQSGYRVHPFNPCLPDPHARTCSRYIPIEGDKWPPFDEVAPNTTSGMPGDVIPFSWGPLNHVVAAVTYSDWQAAGYPNTGGFTGPWNPPGWFTGAWDNLKSSGPQGS